MLLTFKRSIAIFSLLGLVIFGGLQILIFISPGEGWGGGYAMAFSVVTVLPIALISIIGFVAFGREVMAYAIKHTIAYSVFLLGMILWGGLLLYFVLDPGDGWRQKAISIVCVLVIVLPGLWFTYIGSKRLLSWANSNQSPSNGSAPSP